MKLIRRFLIIATVSAVIAATSVMAQDRNSPQPPPDRPGAGQRIPESIHAELDLPYAATDNRAQRLDLFLPKSPKNDKPLPVIVFIHGGAFRAGDKRSGFGTIAPLVQTGAYAGVSVEYRLTGEAIWPRRSTTARRQSAG